MTLNDNYDVCLFFYTKGKFIIHGCTLAEAENYGDFLIYPGGHFDIWEDYYYKTYKVDYDYFPRGRIAYRKTDDTYLILYDKCIGEAINEILEKYKNKNTEVGFDEHYKCHLCNKGYVVI